MIPGLKGLKVDGVLVEGFRVVEDQGARQLLALLNRRTFHFGVRVFPLGNFPRKKNLVAGVH